MKILIHGLGGHMGREVAKLALAGYRGAELAGGVDLNGCEDFGVPCAKDFSDAITDVNCVIDFSHHSATAALLDFVTANKLPLVLATTGQTEEEKAMIRRRQSKSRCSSHRTALSASRCWWSWRRRQRR